MKKLLFRSSILAITILLSGCSGGDDSPVNDETPPDGNPAPVNYQLGGQGPGGGKIFYLDNTNQHGLEVSEVIGMARWWNQNQNPYNIPTCKTEWVLVWKILRK